MKNYVLTSTQFTGAVYFNFNDDGLLVGYTASAELTHQQQMWLLGKMPRHLSELKRLTDNSKTAKLEEMKVELTFDMFWERYDDKQNSSRKRTKAKWDKMPEGERMKAYKYISRYFQNIPQGTRKKFAETYLNAELWNN